MADNVEPTRVVKSELVDLRWTDGPNSLRSQLLLPNTPEMRLRAEEESVVSDSWRGERAFAEVVLREHFESFLRLDDGADTLFVLKIESSFGQNV